MVGHLLLETPLLNKGSAFSADERRTFGLQGLLPPHIASLEEQLARTYENYQHQDAILGLRQGFTQARLTLQSTVPDNNK